MKKVLFLIVIVVLVLGWLAVGFSFGGTEKAFRDNVALARKSSEEGLYEQGVEYYNAALAIKEDKDLYKEIKDAYKAFYLEQKNSYSYGRYVTALKDCCQVYETDDTLWEELISEYYSKGNYNEAFDAIQKAGRFGAVSEKTKEIRTKISHIYDVSYTSILSYKTGRNNTYSVTDGKDYWIIRYNGEKVGIEYEFVGPLDEKGRAVFTDKAGSNIRDVHQITRILLDKKVDDSGLLNSGMVPVCVDGVWRYLLEDGADAKVGEFDYATSMCDGTAAVQKNGKWTIIDTTGKTFVDSQFDDIVLDQYERYTAGDCFIALQRGSYYIFDMAGNIVVELKNVSDIDVGEFGDLFAFQDSNTKLWGYMDYSGNTVVPPTYSSAKGYSFGYAAVANDEDFWKIIDMDGNDITEYEFYYIGYFTGENNCLVSKSEGAIGVLQFKYLNN